MIGLPTPEAEIGPFGPPDGARADLNEIRRNFVRFTSQTREDSESGPSIRSPRVIVGKKGVGKTVYLRQFQADASDRPSVYADEVRHDVPATEDVIKVCQLYPAELAAEGWQWIWRRAIMRSLASHLLRSEQLKDRLDPRAASQLERDYRERLGEFRKPRSVYAEARNIAVEAHSSEGLARELRHRDWDDIEDLLGDIVAEQPPICLYLDSVDERFGSAPLYWLQCQKGLCYQVLELLRDARFANKLHIVVAIRDLVRSSLLQGENATRYMGVPHIRVLDWDHHSIQEFLHEKIRNLPPEYRMNPRKEGIAGWLGREDIYNPARGFTERLEDYLLRHTRLIPRDVVQLGNELSRAVEEAKKDRRRTALEDREIRGAVSDVARVFADEQIAVCANHLASDTMPSVAGRQETSDFYTSPLYGQVVQEELCRFIVAVGTDRFRRARLDEALEKAGGEVLSRHPHPLNVLWQNSLLGYEPEDDAPRSHFYGAHDIPDFQLPDHSGTYVFHPILAHKVAIRAAGDRPVQGFG